VRVVRWKAHSAGAVKQHGWKALPVFELLCEAAGETVSPLFEIREFGAPRNISCPLIAQHSYVATQLAQHG
jgi:hypothetical protein